MRFCNFTGLVNKMALTFTGAIIRTKAEFWVRARTAVCSRSVDTRVTTASVVF